MADPACFQPYSIEPPLCHLAALVAANEIPACSWRGGLRMTRPRAAHSRWHTKTQNSNCCITGHTEQLAQTRHRHDWTPEQPLCEIGGGGPSRFLFLRGACPQIDAAFPARVARHVRAARLGRVKRETEVEPRCETQTNSSEPTARGLDRRFLPRDAIGDLPQPESEFGTWLPLCPDWHLCLFALFPPAPRISIISQDPALHHVANSSRAIPLGMEG